jgi:hypothetical protein
MKVMLTPDEGAATVWDDYLHRFGAEAYVMARYIAAPPTIPINEDAPDLFLRVLPALAWTLARDDLDKGDTTALTA